MILRLNQIVIRIGLRKIATAYSNISLGDTANKLNIPKEDVEFVVAKALRDGIIFGEIDHEQQILKIKREVNIYVTHEPQIQLDKRIRYCLGLYHEVQKAITYPDMKMNLGDFKEEELDASELLNLLDFDDDMWWQTSTLHLIILLAIVWKPRERWTLSSAETSPFSPSPSIGIQKASKLSKPTRNTRRTWRISDRWACVKDANGQVPKFLILVAILSTWLCCRSEISAWTSSYMEKVQFLLNSESVCSITFSCSSQKSQKGQAKIIKVFKILSETRINDIFWSLSFVMQLEDFVLDEINVIKIVGHWLPQHVVLISLDSWDYSVGFLYIALFHHPWNTILLEVFYLCSSQGRKFSETALGRVSLFQLSCFESFLFPFRWFRVQSVFSRMKTLHEVDTRQQFVLGFLLFQRFLLFTGNGL